MIELRAASPGDWQIIHQIAHHTWPDTFGFLMSRQQIDYMLALIYNEESLKDQMKRGHHFLLAVNDEIPVGFTSYELHYSGKPQLMIHKIYLLPQSQGLGIGMMIFDHFTAIAKANNCKMLRLKVFYKNDKAMGFYSRYGFDIAGTETTDIGNGYVVLDNVMTRALQ